MNPHRIAFAAIAAAALASCAAPAAPDRKPARVTIDQSENGDCVLRRFNAAGELVHIEVQPPRSCV